MSVETSRVILYAYRIFIRSIDFLSGRKRRVPYQGPCLDAWKRKAKRYAHHPRHTSKNDRQSRKRKEKETPKKATLPIIQNTRLNPIPKEIQFLSNPSPSLPHPHPHNPKGFPPDCAFPPILLPPGMSFSSFSSAVHLCWSLTISCTFSAAWPDGSPTWAVMWPTVGLRTVFRPRPTGSPTGWRRPVEGERSVCPLRGVGRRQPTFAFCERAVGCDGHGRGCCVVFLLVVKVLV
jgi:hypothetical protein